MEGNDDDNVLDNDGDDLLRSDKFSSSCSRIVAISCNLENNHAIKFVGCSASI